MAENTTETLIGALVIAVAAGFLYIVSQTTAGSGGGNEMSLNASFRSAEGVLVGTDVRMAGVKIGTVTDLALDPITYRAVATFTVPDNLDLASDSQVLVSSEGLLGGSFVEVVPGGADEILRDGDEVEDTQGAVSIVTLLLKFVGGGSE